jgi:hypothetical protein
MARRYTRTSRLGLARSELLGRPYISELDI